jgi:septal ring factor EnvC (AmiA/AmiB activator)
MKNDVLQLLTRYHREVMLPDVQRIVDDAIDKSVGALRNDMYSHFDAMYVRFDRLESEYYALKSWMSRIDERLARVESEVRSLSVRMDRVESELQFVKSHLTALEMRVSDIEKKIDRLATESELVEIRQQIVVMNGRIAALETRH